jgi:hypothetical protein
VVQVVRNWNSKMAAFFLTNPEATPGHLAISVTFCHVFMLIVSNHNFRRNSWWHFC